MPCIEKIVFPLEPNLSGYIISYVLNGNVKLAFVITIN